MLRHFEAAKTSFNSAVQYRAGMALTILMTVVNVGIMYVVWSTIFANGATYGNYNLDQIILHSALAASLFSLMWDDWNNMLSTAIHDGTLFKYTIRPVSLFHYAFWWKAGHRLFALIIEFLPSMATIGLLFGIDFITPEQPLAFTAAIILAFCYFLLFNGFVGISAFWAKRNDGINWVMISTRNLLSGLIIPLSFYPEAIQRVFFFLPFQHVFYVPSTAYIGNYALTSWDVTIWHSIALGFAELGVLTALLYALWTIGEQRYEGVGV